MNEYFIHLLILICIYLILLQGFNIPFGVGRLFNLAHVATYSIGAYTTALFATELGVGFWGCLYSSIAMAGLFSLALGAISLKLEKDYFAIGTIAFAAIINSLLINWKSLTRGVLGVPGIPRPEIFSINFYNNQNFLILSLILVIITQAIIYIFIHNGYGRALRAQAEFDNSARSLGLNTVRLKIISFIIASCSAGLAGCLFAYYINYIDPSSFSLHEMIFVLTIAVVGKPGSFWGMIAGTIFLTLLPEPLRFLDIPSGILGPTRQLLYSLILFTVVYLRRSTLFPHHRRI